MQKLVQEIIGLFLPRKCVFCGEILPTATDSACTQCLENLSLIEGEICSVCGTPKDLCRGHKKQFAYTRRVAAGIYCGRMRTGICNFKFHARKDAAACFAILMAAACRREYKDIKFDLLVAVPMHKSKQRQRGYNQAALLAQKLATLLEVEDGSAAFVKHKRNRPQHSLSHEQRKENIKGVYRADPLIFAGKTILLVDDIATTGNTLEECAHCLQAAGAKATYCLTIALSL